MQNSTGQSTRTVPRRPSRIPGLCCLLITAALLGACASAPAPQVQENPQELAAQSAEARGDNAAAARLWTTLAQELEGSNVPAGAEQNGNVAGGTSTVDSANRASNSAWLRAADNWWLAGDRQRSNSALARVLSSALDPADNARLALLQGEMALQARDSTQAEFFLAAADGGRLPRPLQARLAQALSAAQALREDPDAALLADIQALIEQLEPVNSQGALQIVQELESVSTARLQDEALQPTRLGQWAMLALDLRETLVQRKELLEAASAWATLNPLHPVDEQGYLELAWQYGQAFTVPERIAVLLPSEGPLAAAGAAIRDGLVSAWLENPARSELTFLNIGEDPEAAADAYLAAGQQGFDWVIGPLRRESVDAIVDLPGTALPGLLLNWPSPPATDTPFAPDPGAVSRPGASTETDLFSIALSQEAEAQAVARQMLAEGYQRSILLLTDSAWGERTEAAFVDAYLQGGGEVVALERFSASDADHSARLTRLLQIEDGRERRRRLQTLLNLPLEFEDSRRDDFGAFFMAADPVLGRQLKPQLRFFEAGGKAVFAMGRVYSGRSDPSADADLNGIVIPSTRWALLDRADTEAPQDDTSQDPGRPTPPPVPALDSLRNGAFGSLHALGRDAWNLLPWLEFMRQDPAFTFPGVTGDLVMGEAGQIQRQPVWAEFRRGRPVPHSIRDATPRAGTRAAAP